MRPSIPACPRCQGQMEQGLVLDIGHGGSLKVAEWLEGAPEPSFWHAMAVAGGAVLVRTCAYIRLQPPHITFRVFTMLNRSLVVLAAMCCTAPLRAQSTDTSMHTAALPARHTVLTLNPFAVIAAYFTADIERAVSRSVSIGASGSLAGNNDFNHYGSLEANVRYYPNERVLQGFSIGATIGVATARSNSAYVFREGDGQTIFTGSGSSQERITRATAGTELSYQWLLGPRHRFVIVLGGGVKRAFGEQRFIDPFNSSVIPTARVNIGFAF